MPSITFTSSFLSRILTQSFSRREIIAPLERASRTVISDGRNPHFISRLIWISASDNLPCISTLRLFIKLGDTFRTDCSSSSHNEPLTGVSLSSSDWIFMYASELRMDAETCVPPDSLYKSISESRNRSRSVSSLLEINNSDVYDVVFSQCRDFLWREFLFSDSRYCQAPCAA